VSATPQWLVPASVDELAGLLRTATHDRTPVKIAGRSPTVIDSSASALHDARVRLVSLERLPLAIDHAAGDLIATIPAGTCLEDANDALRHGGQWLALDPYDRDLTVGAVIATNASGPRRHRFGTPRDLIIGIEIALADGRLVRAGGRVVKNVAGYDLSRMMCGARGSLGVVTSATFKLTPLAQASATVVVETADAAAACALARAIDETAVSPSAVELQGPKWTLLVRFESTATATAQQAHAVADLARRAGAAPVILTGGRESDAWEAAARELRTPGATLLKASVRPSDVHDFLVHIADGARTARVAWQMSARVLLGVLEIELRGDRAEHSSFRDLTSRIRQWAEGRNGSAIVEKTTIELGIDRWGEVGNALPLMRAVKAQFDPAGILNPGGGPGGL
jgi:glycolate oxidase FAD binding subunit